MCKRRRRGKWRGGTSQGNRRRDSDYSLANPSTTSPLPHLSRIANIFLRIFDFCNSIKKDDLDAECAKCLSKRHSTLADSIYEAEEIINAVKEEKDQGIVDLVNQGWVDKVQELLKHIKSFSDRKSELETYEKEVQQFFKTNNRSMEKLKIVAAAGEYFPSDLGCVIRIKKEVETTQHWAERIGQVVAEDGSWTEKISFEEARRLINIGDR
jgi:hypothetical protein